MSLPDMDGLRDDVQELVRQLDALAGRIDARMDARLSELRGLLEEADRRIAELRRLLAAGGGQYSPSGESRSAEIIRLARQGLDAAEIARRTDAEIGKVELVLNLHRTEKTRLKTGG